MTLAGWTEYERVFIYDVISIAASSNLDTLEPKFLPLLGGWRGS